MNTTTNFNAAQNIINSLSKKSKRSFGYYSEEVKNQAYYFSPAYRDFISNIIKNNSLKIKNLYSSGSIYSLDYENDNEEKLKKRKQNQIYTDINNKDTLPHELGHAVDFWFGREKALSTVVLIEDKTLYDVFTEEFESKYQELYKLVMNEYKEIINSNINDKAYDILINNMPKYRELRSVEINSKDKETTLRRKKLQKELYESGFVETYYLLLKKKCFSILNTKYSPILDALSSKYDFEHLCLAHHENTYYKCSKFRPVYEFFANVFAAKVTSKHQHFNNLIKLLPKSFNAFEKLFVIFYDRIQNNKRFLDVKLKKGDSNEL